MAVCQAHARSALRRNSRPLKGPAAGSVDQRAAAANARIKALIAEARFGSGYEHNSSSGGSSPASSADSDDSDDSDEFRDDLREVRRHRQASPLSSSSLCCHRDSLGPVSPCAPDDDIKLQQHMLLVLPAFAAPAIAAARARALSVWLAGFDVGWVVGAGGSLPLPRREVARRARAWAQALRSMERLFRLRKPELCAEKAAALGELAAASGGAMLKLVRDISALQSSPSKLLAALDAYVPAWETYPVLARLFSWGPSHPVLAAAETALADLVNAARLCRRDLGAFIRTHYPWRMPPGGAVHPCVGFWMGYFRCMLRNRIPLYFVLGSHRAEDGGAGGLSHLLPELISYLEAVLEDKSSAAASLPGLHQLFMLNNTCAIVLHAMGSDLRPFLPAEWLRFREERMEGYIKAYMDAAWAPVLSRLELGRRTRPSSIIASFRRDPLDAFHSALEDQRCWKVPNPVLRAILRKVVTESVAPVYRRFLEDHPEVAGVATKLTADELEHRLSNLFEG